MPVTNAMLIKLQAVELKMLLACIRICEKQHMRYFLLGGSALGAVRHADFIPWDDDIDVGMPRPDYEKFVRIAQAELPPELFLQTYETDPLYPFNFAKIRNSKTTYIESDVSHLSINHGVYIDVFPLDGYPYTGMTRSFAYSIFKIYSTAIQDKLGMKHGNLAIRILKKAFSAFFSLSRLRKKLDVLMKKYSYDECDIVFNWYGAWGLREAVPRDFFKNGLPVKFREVNISIPKDYDRYLKSLYGDYMTPPPMEKRISHHFTDVIDLENPYTKHTGDHL